MGKCWIHYCWHNTGAQNELNIKHINIWRKKETILNKIYSTECFRYCGFHIFCDYFIPPFKLFPLVYISPQNESEMTCAIRDFSQILILHLISIERCGWTIWFCLFVCLFYFILFFTTTFHLCNIYQPTKSNNLKWKIINNTYVNLPSYSWI